jgi:hypothetical protein
MLCSLLQAPYENLFLDVLLRAVFENTRSINYFPSSITSGYLSLNFSPPTPVVERYFNVTPGTISGIRTTMTTTPRRHSTTRHIPSADVRRNLVSIPCPLSSHGNKRFFLPTLTSTPLLSSVAITTTPWTFPHCLARIRIRQTPRFQAWLR